MIKEIKFRKEKILFGITFSLFMFLISLSFLIKPELFIRNQFRTVLYIQIFGVIGTVYFSTLLYSFIKLLNRKFAIKITENFLIDNSRYESFGKIEWNKISHIRRVSKNCIELFLDESIYQKSKKNLLGNFLRFMNNWNYNERVIISSALLQDCSIEELYQDIFKSQYQYSSIHLSTLPTAEENITTISATNLIELV